MARCKDSEWQLPEEASWERANLATLMDIRDELKRLNGLLHCHNFVTIPAVLRSIRRKLPTPKKPKGRK